MISWDIETEALPGIEEFFDPGDVKLGNLKDEVKIKAKVDDARRQFVERGALSATTGRVLAIGYYHAAKDRFECEGIEGEGIEGEVTEVKVINRFWDRASAARNCEIPLVGLNIFDFDLPFLARRSWILNI